MVECVYSWFLLLLLLWASWCAFCSTDWTFWAACVYSAWLVLSRIYVYSTCLRDYKGIFHSVMLINLISKSRNMKKELKKQTSTVTGCEPAYFQPIFFSSAFFFLFLYPTVKHFNWEWLCRPICQGFWGEQWCYHGTRTPLCVVNRSQWFPIGMILHAGWREKAAGPPKCIPSPSP